MDIDFRSTSDDNLEPSSMRGGVGQSPQDPWTTESVAALINCVDDKYESTFRGTRKFADELKEERVVHRPWRQVWVVTKVFCHQASKWGEDYREFVNESRKDICGLAQIPVIPSAEKSAGKVVFLVKAGTN